MILIFIQPFSLMSMNQLTRATVIVLVFLAPLLMAGCLEEDDGKSTVETNDVTTDDYESNETQDTAIIYDYSNVSDSVEYIDSNLVEDEAIILVAANGGRTIQLINKSGFLLHEWNLVDRLGNDFQLLPNGDILAMFKLDNVPENLSHGGYGGSVQIIAPDGTVKWRYDDLTNETMLAHHDVELLPNGNILVMVWEKLNCTMGLEMGIDCQTDLSYESIYEVNITDNSIVWKWRSVDHIIQDRHPEKPNFGNISSNPHRIDFNLNTNHPNYGVSGDIMHANGIDYDEDNNLIYLSVNFYSEVWVIDHSTTTEQAATHTGGNYGMGGNLVYRFGNSAAYQSDESIIFEGNHYPNLIEEPNKLGFGNILVFSNGADNISTIFELSLPISQYPTITAPEVVWNFSNEDLFSGKLSGAERGRNNNTYIAEGDYGIWEVNQAGEIAWKYNFGTTWRAYVHYYDEPGIQSILSQTND